MGRPKKELPGVIIYSVTGHRPDKIFNKDYYSIENFNKLCNFIEVEIIDKKIITCRDLIWTGMALGWDMAIAVACARKNIRFMAAVPCKGQEKIWPWFWQDIYNRLLLKATRVKIVSPGKYAPEKMYVRNEFLVDKSDKMLSLWNGDIIGGTASCLKYARFQGREIVNLWDKWVKFRDN